MYLVVLMRHVWRKRFDLKSDTFLITITNISYVSDVVPAGIKQNNDKMFAYFENKVIFSEIGLFLSKYLSKILNEFFSEHWFLKGKIYLLLKWRISYGLCWLKNYVVVSKLSVRAVPYHLFDYPVTRSRTVNWAV